MGNKILRHAFLRKRIQYNSVSLLMICMQCRTSHRVLKAVMDYCLKEGHSIIKLEANGFSNYTTCPGELFDYCMQGQVLLLVPSELPHVERKGKVSRQECVFLNERARVMCGSSST